MQTKHIVVVIDGMADRPLSELEGKTPLAAARTPHLDHLADVGEVGMVRTIPRGFAPGSDVANLSVLGYDPRRYYTGRAPLEGLSMGIELKKGDVAYRCNLVTLEGEGDYASRRMVDYSAGGITTGEAGKLIRECAKQLGNETIHFHPGISYRHLMVWNGGVNDIDLIPPHDIAGCVVERYLPFGGEGAERLRQLMEQSAQFLPIHQVNRRRDKKGLPAANSIWLWGQGTRPQMPAFEDRFGRSGSVISAVDLIKGIGVGLGLTPVEVPGATGRIDTNFQGKAEAAVRCLAGGDNFVFLHFEAPDEAAHQGDLEQKILAIERIDSEVLPLLLGNRELRSDLSIMVLADHPTPVTTRTHASDPVPFLMARKPIPPIDSAGTDHGFSERAAEASGVEVSEGCRLLPIFFE